MKKLMTILLAAVLLLLCACRNSEALRSSEPTETTEPEQTTQSLPPLVPITGPSETTQPTTEPVETTEPTKTYDLTVEEWLVEEPEYLSYEEYFAEDRPYFNEGAWLKADGELLRSYCVLPEQEGLIIYCEQTGQTYLVPDTQDYADASLLLADGKDAYVYHQQQIVKVDLETGSADVIFSGPIIRNAYTENFRLGGNLVAYYAAYEDGILSIGRIYLPEARQDILYSEAQDCHKFYLFDVGSTKDVVKWTLLRQEFVDAVEKAWNDADSVYKSGEGYDLTEVWGTEEGLDRVFSSPLDQYWLQEAIGIRALEEVSLHADGSITTRIGALDSCYFGSDVMHDHYEPDVNTVPEIKPSVGEWTSVEVPFALTGMRDTDSGHYELFVDVTGSQYLYYVKYGEIVYKLEEPVLDVLYTGECLICQLPDGDLYALNLDDFQLTKIYQSKYGGIRDVSVSYADRESLCILDGNCIIEFDLVNCRYRTLLQHDYIVSSYFADEDEREYLYFFVRRGMYVGQFLLYMDNFELEQVYWL